MPEPLAIDLDQLRNALVRVLDACEEQLGRHVTVEGDYYWHLPLEPAFDMSKQPTEFTVGQLSDDLHATSGEAVDPLTAWHALAHVNGILRALEARVRP
jgi:hypothetical protein